MTAKRRKKKKRGPSGGKRALTIAYRVVVALSAVIVALFVVYKMAVRPPAVPVSAVPTAAPPSDDPDTPDIDESTQTPPPTPTGLVRKEQCYTFLLAASDQVSGNSDTIMVVSYDVPHQKIGVVSIPRDTLVDRRCEKATYHKINSSYALGGIAELERAVSELLGIPIDYTITVNIQGFVKLVDAVGGIDFQVPVRMNYDAPDQNLHIHYDKKMYYGLTGQQVLEIARCRSNSDGDPKVNYGVYPAYPDSDIGRTRTQQQLLVAIAKKMLSWNSLTKLTEYLSIFSENVKTDVALPDMIWFVEQVYSGLDLATGISTGTLPGDGAVSYKGASVYELFPEEVLELVNTTLNPYTQDLTLKQIRVFQK